MKHESNARGWAGAVVGGFLASGALFACGSSSTPSSGASPGGATSGTTTVSGSCKAPADQCALLTTSEAATAVGATTTTTTPGTMGPGDPSIGEPASGGCAYSGDNEDLISVAYVCGFVSDGAAGYLTALKAEVGAGVGVAVAGLGDEAVWSTTVTSSFDDSGAFSGGTLTILAGDAYVTITLVGAGTAADLEARAVAAGKIVLAGL